MSEHRVTVAWTRGDAAFERASYPRDHDVRFAGGQAVRGSAAAAYQGNPALADPEQMFAASLAACHMLTFLAMAANRGLVVDAYEDDAVALLGKNEAGRVAVVRVTLRPRVRFADGAAPDAEAFAALHERAHGACFVAQAVRCEVRLEPGLT